jgi:hypothetical protein
MEKPRKLPKHELVGTAYPVLQTLPSHVLEGIGKIIFSQGAVDRSTLLAAAIRENLLVLSYFRNEVSRLGMRVCAFL